MRKVKLIIDQSWFDLLSEEFQSEYFSNLQGFLDVERQSETIYPPEKHMFNAFNHTPVSTVKAVILGQDPYHGPNQAHGLCFSVNDEMKSPPSLRNIFKELSTDIGMDEPKSGNLTNWADQGVLLLNATLTVRKSYPGSHQGKGWERFTDVIIQKLSNSSNNLVFLLWGKFAQNKESLINKENGHLILKAPHPSPFSAHTGFFGSKHFSQTNDFLKSNGLDSIDWNLTKQ